MVEDQSELSPETGFEHSVTFQEKNAEPVLKEKNVNYFGIDVSADSAVGNLVKIELLVTW